MAKTSGRSRILEVALLGALLILARTTGAAPVVPADGSHTIQEYVAMGVPPIDRDWTWDDVITTLSILERLDPHELPRARSQRSSPLFEKLRESDLHKETLSIAGARSPEEVASRSRSVANLYKKAVGRGLLFDRELLILGEQDLHRSARMIWESRERREALAKAAGDSARAALVAEQNEMLLERAQEMHTRELTDLIGLLMFSETNADVRRDLVALLEELSLEYFALLQDQQVEALEELMRQASAFDANAPLRTRLEALADGR